MSLEKDASARPVDDSLTDLGVSSYASTTQNRTPQVAAFEQLVDARRVVRRLKDRSWYEREAWRFDRR
jgi:hypothetical protein